MPQAARAADAAGLPPGAGRAIRDEDRQRASARLAILVPIALGAISQLSHPTFNSVRRSTLVSCNVPFAATGGASGMRPSGEFLSVPAFVGSIALVGIAVLNGVVLASCTSRSVVAQGLSLLASHEGHGLMHQSKGLRG